MSSYTAEMIPGLDCADSTLPSPPPSPAARSATRMAGASAQPESTERRKQPNAPADALSAVCPRRRSSPPPSRRTKPRRRRCSATTSPECGGPTWKAQLVAEGLKPATVNTYLSLLGTILNTAVDSDHLPSSPLMRKSRAGRVAAAKNLPAPLGLGLHAHAVGRTACTVSRNALERRRGADPAIAYERGLWRRLRGRPAGRLPPARNQRIDAPASRRMPNSGVDAGWVT
jgi:hypothetical protein